MFVLGKNGRVEFFDRPPSSSGMARTEEQGLRPCRKDRPKSLRIPYPRNADKEWATPRFMPVRKKAILSLRLRLRSGLRQIGRGLWRVVYGRVGDPAFPGLGWPRGWAGAVALCAMATYKIEGEGTRLKSILAYQRGEKTIDSTLSRGRNKAELEPSGKM
jgi:hypothetical protein